MISLDILYGLGGLCAVLFNSLPNQLGLIIAALAGVAAGVIAEARMPQPLHNPSQEVANHE